MSNYVIRPDLSSLQIDYSARDITNFTFTDAEVLHLLHTFMNDRPTAQLRALSQERK